MKDIFLSFLKLGFSAFGGPAAHIALMEEEYVVRRQWISREDFLDMLGATNLIPGPNSSEMALHIGYRRGGMLGLFLAGVAFIFPAVLLTILLALLYLKMAKLPNANGILLGFQAAAVGLILSAVWRLGKKAIKTSAHGAIFISAGLAAWLTGSQIASLFGAAFFGMGFLWFKNNKGALMLALISLWPSSSFAGPFENLKREAPGLLSEPFSLQNLFIFFLKIGSILYGSGYVLFAFLEGGLVNDFQWLTSAQLLEAVAAGQLTPGPVLSTSAFIGTILGGPWAGVAAAVGIFLPSFLFVLILGPLLPRARQYPLARLFLDAINASAIGLMGWVGLELLAKTAQVPSMTFLALVLGGLVVFKNLKGPWAIAIGGCGGLILSLVGAI